MGWTTAWSLTSEPFYCETLTNRHRSISTATMCINYYRKPLAELTSDGGDQEESLTSANSLPVWVDWVQHYSTTVSSNSPLDEEVSVNHL